MKKLLFLLCFLLASKVSSGQDAIRVFGGVNLTNVKYYLHNSVTNSDTSYLRSNNYFLPNLGADINFKINSKFSLTTGIGVSFMGSRNYSIDFNVPNINIDTNLRIGYLRFPFIINYNIVNGFSIFSGYSLNYSFRKNQSFFALKEETPLNFEYKGLYNGIHHALLFGITQEWKNWNITANYHAGISRIWDSKDFDPQDRAYLTLNGFQFTIGYLIRN